jgi:hypothetical protein
MSFPSPTKSGINSDGNPQKQPFLDPRFREGDMKSEGEEKKAGLKKVMTEN